MDVEIYTDGGWFRCESFAAWSFIALDLHPQSFQIKRQTPRLYVAKSGIIQNATNNGAEVIAVAYAIDFVCSVAHQIGEVKSIIVYSDCDRPIDGLNGLLDRWANNDWKVKGGRKSTYSSSRKSLAEKECWVYLYAQKLRAESMGIKIQPIKVLAHTGNYWNERADKLVKRELAIELTNKGQERSA